MSRRQYHPTPRSTIKDVARVSGVSTQTVSRVLNDRPDVSDDTRRKIKQVIDDLNYHPSALARSLIHKRSYTLGVILYGLKYVGVNLTLAAIIEQAQVFGYNLLIKELANLAIEDVHPVIRNLLASEVEGIIYAVQEWGDNWHIIQEQLAEPPVPIIYIKHQPHPRFCTISVDNYAGGCLATQHLIDNGRKHIAHICGPERWQESGARMQGWQDTLHAAGLSAAENQFVVGDWSSACAEKCLLDILRVYPQVDAIFAANDQMALGVMHTAARRGIHVPGDLAVVGFDDIAESAFFTPSLTTIRQDFDQLGAFAIRKMLQIIGNEATLEEEPLPDTIVLQPQLVLRESSSPRS